MPMLKDMDLKEGDVVGLNAQEYTVKNINGDLCIGDARISILSANCYTLVSRANTTQYVVINDDGTHISTEQEAKQLALDDHYASVYVLGQAVTVIRNTTVEFEL